VDDLIEGLIRLMNSPDDVTGPVNLGNPAEVTVKQLAEEIIQLSGSEASLSFEPLPTDDPVRRCPDISLARRLLGWEPKVPRSVGLAKAIEYFRTHPAVRAARSAAGEETPR
jgi:UDP-glucuronate decarboxylase